MAGQGASYSVGQVAGFAGVTVRTLHYYDREGLLSPSERTAAGYRLYNDRDLARLQQILFYRELEFPVEEIRSILDDPQANAVAYLKERHRQLNEQITKLQKLVEVAEQAIEVERTGVRLSPEERFDIFGEVRFDLSYATDAQVKWADSARQRESMARAARHSKADWRQLMSELAQWRAELIVAFEDGQPADGERAMDLAEQHRAHVERWFTPCPAESHRLIAADYLSDPRAFAMLVPPSEQLPGLARFLHAAIDANAGRLMEG
ncbi:MerR family transcriptional regulator [Kitasatospora cheerisanensis]|uniref:Transcriptional regulator n=1 Tax=Kitasatospora cheerisanensis KCTC 2395 TaxID=1348663 RepID=A0A066Z1M8_9ACTN|nr:MerR family transcriptional regulator [Kitasatospora cheerisanensis]KDN87422.1 transcriptional regulator [Kitasatospora cheerisanensis KCTC 2395]